MVGFGKFLHDVSTQHGVAEHSLNYKSLKKILRAIKGKNNCDNASASSKIEPEDFITKLEEEMSSVNQVVRQKLKVLQRVRKAVVAARQVRGCREAQEHGIVLIQLSNVYDDVILVLWFMYLNSIAVSKIVKKYNKNVPTAPYTVDPSRWLFLSTGLAHAQRAKASIEAEYAACVDSLPGEGEMTLVEQNKEVSELAKGMKALMQEHKHHLYRSYDPTEWAVIPALERSHSRRGLKQAPSLSSLLWQGGEEICKIDEPNLTREYRLGAVIGSGAYGVVCKATHKATGRLMAVKTIHDTWSHPVLGQRSYREIQILQQLRHPNIIELTDVVMNHNKKDVHLIMPYIPHTCEDLLVRRQLLAEHKKVFMLQLLSALAYIHERGVVHRDLKLSNILVDETPRCYLSDFGLARTLSGGTETTTNDNPDYIQTQWYRAPEVLLCSRTTTSAADMWSFGCILAELLTGIPLFPGQDQQQQLELILACCTVDEGCELMEYVHNRVKTNKLSLSGPSLQTRRTLEDTLRGCWKAGFQESCPDELTVGFLKEFLRFGPKARVSAKDALEHKWFTEEGAVNAAAMTEALEHSLPLVGENPIVLELTCTKLHSAAAYREAVEASPKVVNKKREQQYQIELHQAAAAIQRFWRWRRRGGERPPPRPKISVTHLSARYGACNKDRLSRRNSSFYSASSMSPYSTYSSPRARPRYSSREDLRRTRFASNTSLESNCTWCVVQ
eukprot:TRINITY_DN2921_c0_g1_i4.p1 TRINITY_DN2921_c0_g1~~TRINITY_DN2921_c0_g1_i4.p1  ORF type:complete len:728 (+),score=228.33 TRINITY_DN2921_c0_g1_i4:36-2219(+)